MCGALLGLDFGFPLQAAVGDRGAVALDEKYVSVLCLLFLEGEGLAFEGLGVVADFHLLRLVGLKVVAGVGGKDKTDVLEVVGVVAVVQARGTDGEGFIDFVRGGREGEKGHALVFRGMGHVFGETDGRDAADLEVFDADGRELGSCLHEEFTVLAVNESIEVQADDRKM